MTVELGRLQRVTLRDVWQSEPQDFTPWLAQAENLKLLGETIGVELELEALEKDVGPFRADILCKDTENGDWVLIENQLASTDHTHLGQLLTYAAGLRAATIIWIAERFTDEHRATLDWLNEITGDSFTFFGIEVELWRIENSLAAPKFNMVSKPNDWTKTVATGAARLEMQDLTEAKRLQLEFWTVFRKYAEGANPLFRLTKPSAQHWMSFALGRVGFHLSAVASLWDSVSETYETNELRAEVVIDGENAKSQYKLLEALKPMLELETKDTLTWYNPIHARACRIYIRRSADLGNRNNWPEYHQWLLTKLNHLHSLFAKRVKELPWQETA